MSFVDVLAFMHYTLSFSFAFCLLLSSVAMSAAASEPLSDLVARIISARNSGDLRSADTQATALLDTAIQNNNTLHQGIALFQLARNAMEGNDYLPAQDHLNRAIGLFQSAGDQRYLGRAYRQLGLTYRYQSNYSVSLEYLYMALAIFQSLDDEALLANIHNSLGVVLEKMGQFADAAEYHQLALDVHYKRQDQGGIASALYNLGDIRRTMGDLELARDYFKQSLAMDEKTGDKKNIAYSSYKLGYVSMLLGDNDTALALMQRAHSMFVAISARRDTDWALSGLAELAYERGELPDAERLISGIIARARQHSYHSLFVDAAMIAGKVYLAGKQYANAQTIIDEGIAQAASSGEMHQLSQLLSLKVDTAEQLNDISAAYDALKQQNTLELDAFNANRLNAIASLQAQTEFVRRASQIQLMQNEQALKEAQLSQARDERRFIILGMLSLIIVSFLVYSRVLQSRYTRRLESDVKARTQELQQANQELEALSLTDKLTGLKNRRFFEAQIEKDMQTAQRQHQDNLHHAGEILNKAKLAVFIIDLDHFKQVNDSYGHAVGDAVLRHTSHRLQQVFRDSDILVRWGGEEFVAAARFIDKEEAPLLAARITDALHAVPTRINEEDVVVTCSIGFVCFPLSSSASDDYTISDLFSIADSCLYAAKNNGRDTWVGVLDIHQPVSLPLPTTLNELQAAEADALLRVAYDERRA